jgi:hypothetical protein
MEATDGWVLDEVLKECGHDAPEALVQEMERFARALGLDGTSEDRRTVSFAVRAHCRLMRKGGVEEREPERKRKLVARGLRKRHDAAQAALIEWARGNAAINAFRDAWRLSAALPEDEPERAVELARRWSALPEGPDGGGLKLLAEWLARDAGWSHDACVDFIVTDMPPAGDGAAALGDMLSPAPMAVLFRAAARAELERADFALKRRARGEKWRDIARAWTRKKPEESIRFAGKRWRRLQLDVGQVRGTMGKVQDEAVRATRVSAALARARTDALATSRGARACMAAVMARAVLDLPPLQRLGMGLPSRSPRV